MKTSPLEGKDIFLRPIISSDATNAYVGWLNDPEVNQYLESRFSTHSTESLRKYIEEIITNPNNHFFAIVRRDSEKHIGNIKLGPIDWNHKTGDIGLMIGDKSSWGKGYATEAIGLVTNYAFDELGLRKVTAGAYENNIGSIKAFLKQGFVEEGRKKKHFKYENSFVDHVLLAKFKEVIN